MRCMGRYSPDAIPTLDPLLLQKCSPLPALSGLETGYTMQHVQSFGNASEHLLDLGGEQLAGSGGGAEHQPRTHLAVVFNFYYGLNRPGFGSCLPPYQLHD